MKAPVAQKIAHEIVQHGISRVDDYHWLRDRNWQKFIAGDLDFDNPAVLEYIRSENAYKDEWMKGYKEVEENLYGEVLSRIREDDESWPVKEGAFFYYTREEKGRDYPILCRKKGSRKAHEEVYFDVNKEAEGKELYIFGASGTNLKQTHFAYSFNLTGSMERTIRVRDLETGQDLKWEFQNSTGSFLWHGNEHLYIVERDESGRGRDVYKVDIHKGVTEKELIYSKPEEYDSMFLSLSRTNDREYFMIHLDSGSTHVVYVAGRNSDQFEKFAVGENDVSFSLEHYRGDFYILTNQDEANDFKVMKCPAAPHMPIADEMPVAHEKWAQENWQDFIAEQKGLCLSSIHFYSHFLIVERKNNQKVLDEVAVMDMDSGTFSIISMPEEAHCLEFYGDWDHQATVVRLDYDSPISPNTVFELNLENGALTEVYRKDVPNFNASLYEVKREFAPARDGEQVPLTIIYKKGTKLDGSNKTMVYGYGSYGHGMSAGFSSPKFSLIDRGFVYAIAHIRGGDDKGYDWYLNGKMQHKMNTFNDFIDCCEYLIHRNYTSKGQIAINGGSAGGLLMGAVTNMRPDLFGCVVADVAFVDVINTISDASLPLTAPEWEEWGNPITSKEDFDYISGYSPYDNIEAGNYPPALYNSGISDEQVTYWEPTKMVAKLRALKTDDNPLILNMKMHAGHAGASRRYEWIQDIAFDYSFILKCFDMR
ncbi:MULTISPECIES: S9 family peptidase [unclassified Endozoicomonas]|uniref:S9 family peptidase n=1 Tax=unclassified Endozoicomonas TaxID=2644528 RepID=UPI0021490B06|nr:MULTISPECIES: prolyl oligopeptidase family serine peptidase [unclassified Endozoicomonas]